MASLKNKWELGWSEEHRRFYYMDRVNGKSQWTKPPGCTLDADAATKEVIAKQNETDKVKPGLQHARREAGGYKDTSTKYHEALPQGWEAHKDPGTGKWFFYNKATKLRTWYKPAMPTQGDSRFGKSAPMVSEISGREESQKQAEEKKAKVQEMVGQLHDAPTFLIRLEEAMDNPTLTKQVLTEVKSTNDDLVSFKNLHIPRTLPVTYKECMKALIERQVQGYRMPPSISISERTTTNAIEFFASDPKRVVCALNFANGTAEGYGSSYPEGGDGQEEDLCRRCSTLYESLSVAKTLGHYPFGPPTCTPATKEGDEEKALEPGKYCDVLFTPHSCKDKYGLAINGLQLTRGKYEDGFPILPDEKCKKCCLVSAAAPRAREFTEKGQKKTDVVDSKLLFQLITTIFVAPVLKEPSCTTLILGAWGCSKEGNNPVQIAQLFAEAITRKLPSLDFCLGNLYHEIHFAIPSDTNDDKHHRVFFQVFEKNNITATII